MYDSRTISDVSGVDAAQRGMVGRHDIETFEGLAVLGRRPRSGPDMGHEYFAIGQDVRWPIDASPANFVFRLQARVSAARLQPRACLPQGQENVLPQWESALHSFDIP